jgi:uncharacterized protein with GYD domain
MSSYLLQAAYTPEAWANLVAQPQDRIDAVRPVVEKLGGKVVHGWFAFGDYDVVAIIDMPTNVEAAAFSIAAASAGAIRSIKTTPLLTAAEGIEAMKKAGMSGYKAPTRAAETCDPGPLVWRALPYFQPERGWGRLCLARLAHQ